MPILEECLRIIRSEKEYESALIMSQSGVMTLEHETNCTKEAIEELECENKENKKKYLALLIGQFPDTTETYKKYKKQLQELLQESEDK